MNETRKFVMFVMIVAFVGVACDGQVTINSGDSRNGSENSGSTNSSDPTTVELPLPEDCITAAGYFRQEVWPKIGDTNCVSCHTSAGAASGSAFVLEPSTTPDYLAHNFTAFSAQAEIVVPELGGESHLVLKSTNVLAHEGGAAIAPGSDQHTILASFSARINGTHVCDPSQEPPLDIPYYEGVTFAPDVEVLRRVTLMLAARLPTPDEISTVESNGLDGLDLVMDGILAEPAFYDRLKESFHDVFLTAGFDDAPEGVFGYTHFYPTRNWFEIYGEPEIYGVVDDLRTAVAEEPMELIAYIVRNDRPFTEILTADYIVVSPYTARSWGIFDDISDQFEDPNDPMEFIQARLPALRYWEGRTDQVWPENTTGFYAHAGIQSTFNYLLRHRSTDTNRNRLRARQFFDIFLGVDIMELGPAVTDSAAASANFEVPTMEAPDCVTCHRILDPVAGMFRDYSNIGEVRPREWYDDMFPAGYDLDTPFPESERWRALQWLGGIAAEDPRFPPAMAEHAYYVLTQENVMRAPADTEDPLFASKRNGYEAQREAINDAAAQFAADGHNFKTAIKAIVRSPFYRANGAVDQVEDIRRETELTALGLGKLLTPEQLERKLAAVFAEPWGRLGKADVFTPGDFYMLYGGLDYYEIFERVTQPNGVMGAIIRLMSNELACEYAQRDLSTNGPLFPSIDVNETNEATIRGALVHLHEHVLGQYGLAVDGVEIDRSYALFADLKSDGQNRIANGDEPSVLPGMCSTYYGDDPDYSIRAWQGVLTFLLRHPQFLMQ